MFWEKKNFFYEKTRFFQKFSLSPDFWVVYFHRGVKKTIPWDVEIPGLHFGILRFVVGGTSTEKIYKKKVSSKLPPLLGCTYGSPWGNPVDSENAKIYPKSHIFL